MQGMWPRAGALLEPGHSTDLTTRIIKEGINI